MLIAPTLRFNLVPLHTWWRIQWFNFETKNGKLLMVLFEVAVNEGYPVLSDEKCWPSGKINLHVTCIKTQNLYRPEERKRSQQINSYVKKRKSTRNADGWKREDHVWCKEVFAFQLHLTFLKSTVYVFHQDAGIHLIYEVIDNNKWEPQRNSRKIKNVWWRVLHTSVKSSDIQCIAFVFSCG